MSLIPNCIGVGEGGMVSGRWCDPHAVVRDGLRKGGSIFTAVYKAVYDTPLYSSRRLSYDSSHSIPLLFPTTISTMAATDMNSGM